MLELDSDGNTNDSALPVISLTPGFNNLLSSITVTDESGTSLFKSVTNMASATSFSLDTSPRSINQSFEFPPGSYASNHTYQPNDNEEDDEHD